MTIQGIEWYNIPSTSPKGPDIQHIIVSSAGQQFAVWRPLQAAYLLGVVQERRYMMIGYSDIMVMNGSTSASTTMTR